MRPPPERHPALRDALQRLGFLALLGGACALTLPGANAFLRGEPGGVGCSERINRSFGCSSQNAVMLVLCVTFAVFTIFVVAQWAWDALRHRM